VQFDTTPSGSAAKHALWTHHESRVTRALSRLCCQFSVSVLYVKKA